MKFRWWQFVHSHVARKWGTKRQYSNPITLSMLPNAS